MKEILRDLKQPILIILLGCVLILLIIPVLTYMLFASTLKDKESIMNNNNGGVILLDRRGREFFTFFQPKQTTFVPLSDIPVFLAQALISSEDKEFYTHPGVSLRGIIRSVFTDIERKDTVYGGSTITQQLVKNVLLSPQKSFLRKYQEIILAIEIERRFSKNDILEMYLNSVYFGEGAFGIENAAQVYFGKHAKNLSLAESALLVGLLPSPSALSPLSHNPRGALERMRIVLNGMVNDGKITNDQQTQALLKQLSFRPKKEAAAVSGTHFALYVKNELIKKYGEEYITRSGFTVRTSIDLDAQAYAEKVMEARIQSLTYDRATNGAAVVMNPKTGELLAYVGSHNWNDPANGQIDMVITPRQMGSSFKPIIYAAGLEKHLITDATLLHDSPTTFPGEYKPMDYDKHFRGEVLVRRALANSLNIPAVEVMQTIGIPAGLDMAKRLGITTLKDSSQYGLSFVLGSGEVPLLQMTNVYATFANQGVFNSPTAILEIKDKNEKPIYTYTSSPKQVLGADVAYLISSMLSDNSARAEEFGGALTLSRPAAVKTGTSENFTNALTIGYTPSLAVGVWVGNNDNSPMDNVAGSLGAAPIWRQLMEHMLEATPVEQFTIPRDITWEQICASRGLKETVATSSAYTEYFLPDTMPVQECNDITPTIPVTPSPTTQLTLSQTATPTHPVVTIIVTQTPTPQPTLSSTPKPSFPNIPPITLP